MRLPSRIALALALSATPAFAQQPAPESAPVAIPVSNPAASTTASPVAAAPAFSTEMIARAQNDGQLAALNVGTGGWAGGGFASGLLLGFIGTGVSWAAAGASGVESPPDARLRIANQPAEYQQLYTKSYSDKVKAKRKSSALKGGLVGTAAFVLLVVSAGGQ